MMRKFSTILLIFHPHLSALQGPIAEPTLKGLMWILNLSQLGWHVYLTSIRFFISILRFHLSRKMKPHDNRLGFCYIYVAYKSLCLWNLSFHKNLSFCKSTKRIRYIISLGPKNLSKPANTDRKQKGAIYQVVRDCPRVPHTRNGLGQFTVSRLLDQLWRIGR